MAAAVPLSFFDETPMAKVYDTHKLDALSEIARQYARAVLLPELVERDPAAAETFSLWLALFWLLDDVFDSRRDQTRGEDVFELRDILLGDGRRPSLALGSPDPTVAALLATLRQCWPRYQRRMREHTAGKTLLVRWLHDRTAAFLGTLRQELDDVPPHGYYRWRADNGAMDCVVAHCLLFTQGASLDLNLNAAILGKLSRVGLAVSLYNDLVSLPRDWAQRTPNVVTALLRDEPEGHGRSAWDAMREATARVNALISEVRAARYGALEKIVSPVLERSIAWHMREARYADGRELMQLMAADDRAAFEARLLAAPHSS